MNKTAMMLPICMIVFLSALLNAQDIPFETDTPKPSQSPASGATSNSSSGFGDIPSTSGNDIKAPSRKSQERSKKSKVMKTSELSKLDTLAPFSDIAVISRKYLPRTKRFEFSPTLGFILNDAFFTNLVFGGRVAFYLTEKHGAELIGMAFSSSSKAVTDELATERGVGTVSLATPRSYYGAAYKWVPIYGKMALVNKQIVPFETYFLIGGGITGTNQDTSPATLHLGTGQLYAIYQWLAFRWDFSWFTYQTSSNVRSGSGGTYNNLHISAGFSFYFPGAGYR